MYIKVGTNISIFALIILIIIPITTYSYQSEIAANNKYKILNDKRMNCICSRNPQVYTNFIQRLLKINIKNSDIQAKSFLLTHLLQTILLFVSIFAVINSENFTSGLLISVIGYVKVLSSYSSEINDNIILIKDLKGSVSLLKNKF